MRPPPGRVGDGGGAAPRPGGAHRRAEHVPGAELPRAHGVADGLRRRGRRHDVEHGGFQVGGGPPVAVLRRGRRRGDAVRAGGEVAHWAVQPDEPLHPVPPQRRRHPGVPGHGRVAHHRSPPVVRPRPRQGRRPVREPDRRVQPDGRGDHRRERDDRRAGGDVVVQVPFEQAQVHAWVPDRGDALGHGGDIERDAGELAGVEHPPGVQQQHRGAGGDDPGTDALAQHRRHQPGLVLPRPHRGLLHRVRRRLRGDQVRVGRVRDRVRDAQPAHRGAEADVRVADERGDRAGQRDVGRDQRRAGGGHNGGELGVGGADQDGGGAWGVRARRVRPGDVAGHHEVGVLDDGELQVPPGRRLRPQRHPRRGQHQLPGRGGHGGVQGGRQAGGHPGRPLPRHLHRQRHRHALQVAQVPVDLHRHRGGVHRRHAGAVPAAAGGARWRLPVPHGHAAHRPARHAAVRLLRPGLHLADLAAACSAVAVAVTVVTTTTLASACGLLKQKQ
ncbi:Os06g0106800 [Oryza sativa Japonica Group]|uniref:cDNA clone:001-200-F11, full insert sequence n=2 Tax=Oryza sativa subsp. japonica TaxID=39947 RepID=Q0DF95_ORYSJ|nr:Os06g0106800 [Oryza sativa Japonica Group]BAG93419.1 unnamed protein product [Oryza sativa Japonica Group]BAG97326.1 unnamed protein product [Oryza sativa Japonica Group]BAG97362.1 unnamed protein product [Oryza sativa Japonica Group]BAG97433.1 unnamed protein product [Oryza sativa Japonica Group]|eukprot:NP_001056564.1 Os06g0106800 [Oryza sativa Japonica Group]